MLQSLAARAIATADPSSSPGSCCSSARSPSRARWAGRSTRPSSCRDPRARPRSTSCSARASIPDRRPGPDRVRDARRRAGPAVRAAMEQLFQRIAATVPGRPSSARTRPRARTRSPRHGTIAYAEVNLADRTRSEVRRRRRPDQVAGRPRPRAGPARRARRRHVLRRRNGGVERGHRAARGDDHPADRVRFGARHGPADRHRAVRRRDRHRARARSCAAAIDMPSFTTAAVAMVGIGVGIDYALFIVTRYRESLRDGLEPGGRGGPRASTRRAARCCSPARPSSSRCSACCSSGRPSSAASPSRSRSACFMTMVASVTLLPALLGFVGRNIDRLGLPHRRRGRGHRATVVWYRWSRVLQRHPWPAAHPRARRSCSCSPRRPLSMRLGFSDAGNRPTSDTTRQAYDLLSRASGPGFNGPLLLAAGRRRRDRRRRARAPQRDARTTTPGVAFATPPQANPAGDGRRSCRSFPTTSPQDEATSRPGRPPARRGRPAARSAGTDVEVKVGGVTAAADDFASYTAEPPADLHRRRAAALVPAADGRVPQPARAAQGRRHEPAVDRRRVRRRRRRVPVGLGLRASSASARRARSRRGRR